MSIEKHDVAEFEGRRTQRAALHATPVLRACGGSQDGPVSRTLLAGHTVQGAGRAVGGRSPSRNLPSASVCTMSPQEKGCAGHSLLWRQARVCVRPDALFGRVQATRPCHTHLPCRHHERASSNRKATSDLRCHASQKDPQTHSRGSLTHPAHKIGGIPAADSPSIIRLRSGLSANTDNPSWDVPNNRQPSSDTGSDTRAALQKTGLANYGRRIGPGGRGEGAYGAADGPKQRAGTPRLAT